MENASYAIKIAGGIAIAMLVLAVAFWGIKRVSRYEQAKKESLVVIQTDEFNKPLLSYENAIVSGYKMVSLANLASDTNVRYSEFVDGYKSIEIYIKLINGDASIPGWSDSRSSENYKKIELSTGAESSSKYFNMINYVRMNNVDGTTVRGPYYLKTDGSDQDPKIQRQFKELYFQCVDITYDDVTGRVWRMVFDEIRKRN